MTGNSRFAVSVHILAYLAYRQGFAVPSTEIAASVDTNPVVIRRLLGSLVKARLVTGHKGANGGFTLASPPAAISLLTIYRAVERDPHRRLRQLAPNHRCPVGAQIGHILQDVFSKAQAGMEAQLEGVTLRDLEQQFSPPAPTSLHARPV